MMLLFMVPRSILLIFLIQPLAATDAGPPLKKLKTEAVCLLKKQDFPSNPPNIFSLNKDGTKNSQLSPDVSINEGTKLQFSCENARFLKESINEVTTITARSNDQGQMMRISVSANFIKQNIELEQLQIQELGCGSEINVCQWKKVIEPPKKKEPKNNQNNNGMTTTVPSVEPPKKGEPIIFKHDNGMTTIVHPVKEGNDRFYRVSVDSDLTIACPHISPAFISVKCNNKGKLERTAKYGALGNTATKDFEDITQFDCRDSYVNNLKKNGPCGINNSGIKQTIGFEIASDLPTYFFHPVITVCFESTNKGERTLWTEHTLYGSNIAASSQVDGTWKHDDLFSSKPSIVEVYKQESQERQMSKSIIKIAEELYIARGHMSPAGDFSTEAEIRATYHYINAVPQWQAVNNGKWKNCIEESTQLLAEAHGTNLRIISGGYGIMTLDDMKTPIYLGKKIPIPELTWKVVIEESKDKSVVKAVAFVVTNNPFLKNDAQPGATLAKPTLLCTNICDQIKWLKNYDPNSTDLKHGYVYCCEVDELRKKIQYIPVISHNGPIGILNK